MCDNCEGDPECTCPCASPIENATAEGLQFECQQCGHVLSFFVEP